MSGHPNQYTSAGALGASAPTGTRKVLTFILTAGSANAAVTINEQGSGGTAVLALAALAGTQTAPFTASIQDPYLASITGTGAVLNVLE